MRNIRTKVPSQVAATAHYAAQMVNCPVDEVYGVLLTMTVSKKTHQEIAEWVSDLLPAYRETIRSEIGAVPSQE